MKSIDGVGLNEVTSVYSGPQGDLFALLMGQHLHVGGMKGPMDPAEIGLVAQFSWNRGRMGKRQQAGITDQTGAFGHMEPTVQSRQVPNARQPIRVSSSFVPLIPPKVASQWPAARRVHEVEQLLRHREPGLHGQSLALLDGFVVATTPRLASKRKSSSVVRAYELEGQIR